MDTGEVIALSIAGLSLALGVSNALWSAYTWRRSAPRVRVNSHVGWNVLGQWMSSAAASIDDVPSPDPKYGVQMIGLSVENHGRAAVTVSYFGVRLASGMHIAAKYSLVETPHRLEAHDDKVFFIEVNDVRSQLSDGYPTTVEPFVRLGNGKTLFGSPVVISAPAASNN